ncbi:hypothetical protein LINPERHAP1_LOCUS409, partial [Linum perenne]
THTIHSGYSVVGSRITKNPYPGSDNSTGWILLLVLAGYYY